MPKRSNAANKVAQTANTEQEAAADVSTESGQSDRVQSPLDFMLSVLRDPDASTADRKWAAEKAAPFLHPRLQTVEHGGEVTLRHEDALKDLA